MLGLSLTFKIWVNVILLYCCNDPRVSSVRSSVRPSASSLPASPPTLLMLESPNLYAWYPCDTPMHRDGGNIFEIFLHLPVLKKSDFSEFTPKCNFSEYLRNYFNFLSVWGMHYTSYIKRVLSCDFQITLANGNIDGGGGSLKENCLLLQFTSISFYTIDARITKLICMIPLCIQMVATYLKFFYIF